MARRYRVVLVNRDERCLEVSEDQTILEAFEAVGEVLSFGCRYGACITCAARLLEGRVEQIRAKALKQAQIDAGYVLPCIAKPRADCRLLVGRESQRALYRNPFQHPSKITAKF